MFAILLFVFQSTALAGVDSPSEYLSVPFQYRNAIQKQTVRFVTGDGQAFCSGVRVDRNQIVSAGHCFDDVQDTSGFYAEIYNPRTQKYSRIPIAYHVSQFDEQGTDISLVRLASEVAPGLGDTSLPVVSDERPCDPGGRYFSAGFGRDENMNMGRLNINRYRKPSEYDVQPFASTVGQPGLANNQTGIESVSGHACKGDSGGPVFCQSRGQLAIAGVTSSLASAGVNPDESQITNIPDFCRSGNGIAFSNIHQYRDLERNMDTGQTQEIIFGQQRPRNNGGSSR